MSTNLATLYRQLASADGEGMPEPLNVSVASRTETVYMHLASAEDADRWREWWTGHDAAEQWVVRDDEAPMRRRRHAHVGEWRGWRIELVYVTPAGDGS